jgi:hypothetical protein
MDGIFSHLANGEGMDDRTQHEFIQKIVSETMEHSFNLSEKFKDDVEYNAEMDKYILGRFENENPVELYSVLKAHHDTICNFLDQIKYHIQQNYNRRQLNEFGKQYDEKWGLSSNRDLN